MTFIKVEYWYSDAPIDKHKNTDRWLNRLDSTVEIKATNLGNNLNCYTYDEEYIGEVSITNLLSIEPKSLRYNLLVKTEDKDIVCEKLKPKGNRNGLICVLEDDNKEISLRSLKTIGTTEE